MKEIEDENEFLKRHIKYVINELECPSKTERRIDMLGWIKVHLKKTISSTEAGRNTINSNQRG